MIIRILGAGVMGLALASELSQRGYAIEWVDQKGGIGPHSCSWWAGGMLAPFCEGESADSAVEQHGQMAAGWWAEHGGDVQQRGTLVLAPARDKSEITRFFRRSRGGTMIDGAAIDALEPDLAGRFASGIFFATEAHLSPRRTLAQAAARLEQRGVPILPHASAQHADLVIDARGLAARDQLHDLRGVRGEMLLLRCPELQLSRPIRLLHPRFPLYIVPRGQGLFMVGATMIESDQRGPVSVRSMLQLLNAAYALHPSFAEAEILEMGADARPAFPNHLPRLRRRGSTLYVNGLYRHGFLLAPAVARMAADHIETGQTPPFMDEVTL